MKRFTTRIKPRFTDFDVQGILNSAKYLELVGEARMEQMETGYKKPIAEYTALGQSFVISEFNIRYLRPIAFGKDFDIETQVLEIDGAKAVIGFSFKNIDSQKEYASGQMIYHLFDLAARRPVPISEADQQVFL